MPALNKIELQQLMRSVRVKQYEVAAEMGIDEATLCRMLRHNPTQAESARITTAITHAVKRKNGLMQSVVETPEGRSKTVRGIEFG